MGSRRSARRRICPWILPTWNEQRARATEEQERSGILEGRRWLQAAEITFGREFPGSPQLAEPVPEAEIPGNFSCRAPEGKPAASFRRPSTGRFKQWLHEPGRVKDSRDKQHSWLEHTPDRFFEIFLLPIKARAQACPKRLAQAHPPCRLGGLHATTVPALAIQHSKVAGGWCTFVKIA